MKRALLAIIILALSLGILIMDSDEREVKYDCGMAEWHPDIPKEVREECRRLRIAREHRST